MTTSARVGCALLVLSSTMTIFTPALAVDEGVEAKAAFARMKTLTGDWKVVGHDGGHDAKVVFQVTAAGTTVMETQHPGALHEMVTMYHLDGQDLKAVHYCAAGNQPHLKLDRKGSTPDVLKFVFDGGTNLDPAKDMHIHNLTIRFLEGGKVESDWEGYTDGKSEGITKYAMSRP